MKNKKPQKHKPKLPLWLFRLLADKSYDISAVGDLEELYEDKLTYQNSVIVWFWLWWQVLRSVFLFIVANGIWRMIMVKNYLKVVLRNISRHKGYSFINITGLGMGIACCLCILLYVQFETGYDRYHSDYQQIYRIALSSQGPSGGEAEPANTPLLAGKLIEAFPQVEKAARITQWSGAVINVVEKAFQETNTYYVDPELFSIFSIPFIQGQSEIALDRPNTAVITQSVADKYFSQQDPVGQSLNISTNIGGRREYEITGVVEDPPANTHFKYRFLLSFATVKDNDHLQGRHNLTITYVKLLPETDVAAFEEAIRWTSQSIMKGFQEDTEDMSYRNILQPIADIHLKSHLTWEMSTPGSPLYLTIFSLVGVLILLIACFNFMNLTTARSAGRCIEVGVRKVIGARRSQLVGQFLSESFILSLLALVMALMLFIVFLPIFNKLTLQQFRIIDIFQFKFLFGLGIIMMFTGFLGGLYPAFFLSTFKPITMLKSAVGQGARGGIMRKILVVGQFSISIALIVSTLIIFRQIDFMKKQKLGFAKDQKLVLPIQIGETMGQNFETIKEEFLIHHSVKGATASSSIPGHGMNVWWTWPAGEQSEKKQLMNCLFCDYDFFSEFDLKMVNGRIFSPVFSSDSSYGTIILNETAVSAFGWSDSEEALNKEIWDDGNTVIGVCKSFHWMGLQQTIEPLLIMIWPRAFRYITLTVDPADLQNTIPHIEARFRTWFPDRPFEYFFLDADFNAQYRFEERIGKIFRTFTFLGICIACLGLLGLASYMAEQRTKEIGIRKVLGATAMGMVFMLCKEFIRWVFVANLIAWPLAWFAMNHWLQSFAFRMPMSLFPFLMASLGAVGFSLLVVSYQSIKAAYANPVESIRYE